MATAPAPLKSQPLHNFSLPLLKWRKNQRNNHRCRKSFDSGRESSSTPFDHRFPASESDSDGASLPSCSSTLPHIEKLQKNQTQKDSGSDVSAIKEVRSKFIIRIRAGKKPELVLKSNPAIVSNDREGKCEVGEKLPSLLPVPEKRSLRLKRIAEAQNVNKEKRKFSMVLSHEEIEKDFFAITGSKLARRPAIKRAKNAQQQVDHMFPCYALLGKHWIPTRRRYELPWSLEGF